MILVGRNRLYTAAGGQVLKGNSSCQLVVPGSGVEQLFKYKYLIKLSTARLRRERCIPDQLGMLNPSAACVAASVDALVLNAEPILQSDHFLFLFSPT